MDASAKKLVDELLETRRSLRTLARRESAIRTALDIMGIRVPDDYGYMGKIEDLYVETFAFRAMSLPDACLKVLEDHKDISLDKNRIEYLLTLGGYPFEAKDPTNSVEVNLRKLAADGRCTVTKGSGSTASEYRAKRKESNAVENSRATKT